MKRLSDCVSVRLSGRSSVLQVQRGGVWRTVCSEGWNNVLGLSACKQLGYSRSSCDTDPRPQIWVVLHGSELCVALSCFTRTSKSIDRRNNNNTMLSVKTSAVCSVCQVRGVVLRRSHLHRAGPPVQPGVPEPQPITDHQAPERHQLQVGKRHTCI